MSETSTTKTPDRQAKLERLLADYLHSVQNGQPLDRSALIAAHPDLADDLQSFFRNHDSIGRLAEPLKAAVDAPTLLGMSELVPSQIGMTVRYFGDYELLDEIARGGMGVVFKARQVNLNRIVALKMILAGQLANDSDVKRFYAEAEAAAKLDHPGIVPIFEIGQHDGQHYFSMAFVEGESLAKKVANGPLPAREAAQLVQKVAEAVDYAHSKGIIHRDLKPANVLLDGQGQCKVTDFGLAKQMKADSGLTGTGQILGTPSYMPPEQAAGKIDDIGPAADVYSLGAILYCLLTGRPPFQAANPMDTLLQVLDQEPVPPRQLNPQVPLDLETVCLKCLQKLPEQRYESAADLASDLLRWQNGEPTKARPPSIIGWAVRWLRLNAVAAAVIVAFGLIWGTSTGLTVVAIDNRGGTDRIQFWPTSLVHPMGWVRFVVQTRGALAAMAVVAVALTWSVGWVIERATRPKTTRIAFGFCATTGLIAGMVGFVLIAPLGAASYAPKLHAVDTSSIVGVLDAARDTNHPARGQFEYLRKWLPEEKRALNYPGWENDLRTLQFWADHANRLDHAYSAVSFAVVVSVTFFLGMSIASHWAIGLVERRFGRDIWNMVRYAEVFVPIVAAVLSAVAVLTQIVTLMFATDAYDERRLILKDLPYFATAAALTTGLAIYGYWGIARQWRWPVRVAGYFVWGGLAARFVLAFVAR